MLLLKSLRLSFTVRCEPALLPKVSSITSDLRLAEDLATANFRHMQDKVHTDLANLDAYYMEKQEVANRAVTWQNMSLIVALMLYVFFVFQQLS